MPTVIDALIVQLGLDPTEYKRGREQAENEFKKVKDQATKSGREMQDSHKELVSSFRKVGTQALAFFAILKGTTAISDFITDTDKSVASLGRLASLLAENPKRLYAIGAAAERFGGSAQEAYATAEHLQQALYDLNVNGKMPDSIAKLSAMSGVSADFSHGVDGLTDSLAAMFQTLSKSHPEQVSGFAKQIGIDPATVQQMIAAGRNYSAVMKELEKTAPTNNAIKGAEELTGKWAALNQEIGKFGSDIAEVANGPLGRVVEKLTELIKESDEFFNRLNLSETDEEHTARIKTAREAANQKAIAEGRMSSTAYEHGTAQAAGLAGSRAGTTDHIDLSSDDAFNDYVARAKAEEERAAGLSGKRARGGPVDAGKRYLVGEHGPELFTPPTGGQILPNSMLGGAFQVDGREVSRGNPMPVTILQQGSTGSSLWDWLFGKRESGTGGNQDQGGGGESGGLLSGVQQLAHRTARAFGASGDGHGAGAFKLPHIGNITGSTRASGNLAKNQQEALVAARQQGLSDNDAKLVVANASGESLKNPGDVHWDVKHYAHGSFQWDDVRANRIARQFGVRPEKMSVAQQIAAHVWELKTYYPDVWKTLNDPRATNSQKMYALVHGYEKPADVAGAVAARMRYFNGLKDAKTDRPTATSITEPRVKDDRLSQLFRPHGFSGKNVVAGASLSSITNNSPVTTSESTNTMHVHKINVNAPKATDAHGIASSITEALELQNLVHRADYGQA